MIVLYQYRIYRSDLKINPHVTYVFGDNYAGWGTGGQAREMRGEPNAFGIPTKWNPDRCIFDTDPEPALNVIKSEISSRLFKLQEAEVVVFPMYGIGTGLAKLPTTAPKFYEWLSLKLLAIGINNSKSTEV